MCYECMITSKAMFVPVRSNAIQLSLKDSDILKDETITTPVLVFVLPTLTSPYTCALLRRCPLWAASPALCPLVGFDQRRPLKGVDAPSPPHRTTAPAGAAPAPRLSELRIPFPPFVSSTPGG